MLSIKRIVGYHHKNPTGDYQLNHFISLQFLIVPQSLANIQKILACRRSFVYINWIHSLRGL